MARTGRPKTGQGYREDTMLRMLEMRQKFAAFVILKQEHYRKERDALNEIDADLRDGALAWRYGELHDDMVAEMARSMSS